MLWLSLHYLRLDSAAERIAHLHVWAVCNANPNSDSDALNNTNCYANSDTHRHCNGYCYSHADPDSDAKSHTNSETQSDAEVSPDPAAAPVAFIDEKETYCFARKSDL